MRDEYTCQECGRSIPTTSEFRVPFCRTACLVKARRKERKDLGKPVKVEFCDSEFIRTIDVRKVSKLQRILLSTVPLKVGMIHEN